MALGVENFEKSNAEAASVFSSLVRCDNMVRIRTRKGSLSSKILRAYISSNFSTIIFILDIQITTHGFINH